jgi:hypothetical protein
MSAYESASETLVRLRETLEDITAEAAFERTIAHETASERERAAAAPRNAERPEPAETEPVAVS